MNIVEMLDQLAEYNAQVTLLEMDKRRLLDEVKIPAEVLAAQDEANKRRVKLDEDAARIQREIQETVKTLLAEVVDPEIPPEFAAALAAARVQREDIQSQAASRLDALVKKMTEQKAKVDADLQAQVRDVYRQVEQRKAEIAAEFGDKLDAANSNIDKLTDEIKKAVAAEGKTVKGKYYQAVYVKGRVTWNTDMLDGLSVVIPEVAKARKEGQPSVTLRKI